MPPRHPPPSQTPLLALPAVSLDLETTGLDVHRDRIIQIGLIDIDGETLDRSTKLDALIDPATPIPVLASEITGIDDNRVSGAPKIADKLDQLAERLAGRVVIGHHIAFDLAILRYEAERLGMAWQEPVALDVGHLWGALEPARQDFSFDALLSAHGVSIVGRHTAIGDAEAVAEAFVKLLRRLRASDVRTLGEAMSFAARRQDIIRGEIDAGWHASYAGGGEFESTVRIDSEFFSRSLFDVMSAPPQFIASEASIAAAATAMVERQVGALLVGTLGAPPLGIITERDILRTFSQAPESAATTPVSEAMSSPVATLPGAELLYRALARMDRLGIRHLCISDAEGMALGMVSQRDLLHHRARAESLVEDMVAVASSGEALALAFSRVAMVAAGLVAEGIDGKGAARVISRELRAVTAQAADIALRQMTDTAQGPPPAPWCLLVLGSGGRGESLLSADQDNALIYAGEAGDDPWFAEFGKRIADILHDAGVPYCDGGVMAANAAWRATVDGWRDRIEHWLSRARPEDLLSVDIFFDLRPVAGDSGLGERLLANAVVAASQSRPFLGLMGQSVATNVPSIGLFGRPQLEAGRQDLKRDGLLPLVSFARAVGLRVGSKARSTPDRIADVVTAGKLGEADARTLTDLHGQLLTLILEQQLIDISAGTRASSRVELRRLPRVDRKKLQRGLSDMADIVRDVRSLIS